MLSNDEVLHYLVGLPDSDYAEVVIRAESSRVQRVNEAFASELAASPDRDTVAAWLARQHLAIDPGIAEVYYLQDAPAGEIRFIEVNRLLPIPDPQDGRFHFVDFGLDIKEVDFSLSVIDMSADQWQKVLDGGLRLPEGWAIDPYRPFGCEA